jgi:hypothetical protein
MNRRILRIALPTCLSLALVPTAAHADLAPPGEASAVAVQVGELLGLSTSGAQAGPGTTQSNANVIEIGGHPLLGLGGSQTGTGSSRGGLLDVGAPGDAASAQVAPWEASVNNTPGPDTTAAGRPGGGSDSTASARAAVARADVPSVADVDVLESESQASHRATRSTGSGSSNGVHAGLLDTLDVTVLHSEANSEGTGSSYLAGVNGIQIGTDEQLGRVCGLDASPLLSLACLVASGGAGTDPVRAADAAVGNAGVPLLGSLLDPVSVFSAGATAGDGTPAAASVLPAVAEAAPAPVEADSTARALPASAPDTSGGALARTGATVAKLAPLGLMLLALGSVMRVFGLRRRIAS